MSKEEKNINVQSESEKKKKKIIVLLLLLILLLVSIVGCMALKMNQEEPSKTAVIEKEEVNLNDVNGTGQLRIKMNPEITVKKDTMQNLNFLNANEGRVLQCKIKVGDNYVYTGPKLKPSESLRGDFVDTTKLKKGTNHAIAEVYSYDEKSDELMGQTNVKINLNVE